MSTVYVLNKDGKPLMPTTRCGHVRHLLKEQKARVVTSKPFTIQLLYETDDVVQPLYLGIDPGRTNIGVAVVKADGTAVFTAHLETRNLAVNGNDLIAIGFKQGPAIGSVLNDLLNLVIDEQIQNEKAALLEVAAERLRDV